MTHRQFSFIILTHPTKLMPIKNPLGNSCHASLAIQLPITFVISKAAAMHKKNLFVVHWVIVMSQCPHWLYQKPLGSGRVGWARIMCLYGIINKCTLIRKQSSRHRSVIGQGRNLFLWIGLQVDITFHFTDLWNLRYPLDMYLRPYAHDSLVDILVE